jgi:hypothetical protein
MRQSNLSLSLPCRFGIQKLKKDQPIFPNAVLSGNKKSASALLATLLVRH